MASSLSTPARRNSKKLALDVVTGGGVGLGKIERGQSVVNVVIEGDGGLGGAGLGEHGRGVIAESGVGMDLLHQPSEVAGGVVLADGFVEGDERVFNGARAFGGEQSVDGGWPAARRSVSIFSKAATSGLEAQIVGWETVIRLAERTAARRNGRQRRIARRAASNMKNLVENLGWNDLEPNLLDAEKLLRRACYDVKRGGGIRGGCRASPADTSFGSAQGRRGKHEE